MRAKNSVNRKYDIAKLAILVACFIFVFAATFIVSATVNTSGVDVADAASKIQISGIDDDNGGKVGSAGLTFGNQGRELTALDFGFPGTSGGNTSWTYNDSMTNVVATASNFEASGDGGNEAPLWMEIENPAGLFKSGSDNVGSGRKNNYSVINYNLGNTNSFLASIMNNTMYRLDVTISCTLTAWCNSADNSASAHTTVSLGLKAADSTVSSLETSGISWSSQTVTGRGSKERTVAASVTISDLKHSVISIWGRSAWSYIGTKRDYWMSLSNIQIAFTITKANENYNASTVKVDGGAPVVSSKLYGLASQINNPAPYADKIETIPNSNKVKYGTKEYDKDLSSALSKRLDSITDGSGTMQSYTNEPLGTITVGGTPLTYYKSLQVEYVDTYNYQTSDSLESLIASYGSGSLTTSQIATVAGAGDKFINNVNNGVIQWGTGNVHYASGIKSVQVGDTVVDVTAIDSGSTGAAAKIMLDDGDPATADDSVGIVQVKRTNSARVVVSIYMFRNAKINTIVKDFGSGSCTTSVTFAGIDNKAPLAELTFATEETNIIFTNPADQDSMQWVRTSKLSINVSSGIGMDEADDEFYSPYVWFYTVSRNAGSAASINKGTVYGSFSDLNGALRPVAFDEINTFTYDFTTGEAEGITSTSRISGGTGATGCGYYYFTFYVCDLAGNITSNPPQSFYIKADYAVPYSTTTLITDKNENITKDKNGKWADCGETLTVELLTKNISGNTLLFDDSLMTHVLVINGEKMASLDGVALTGAGQDSTIVHITGIDSEGDVTISIQPNGTGGILIQFYAPTSELFAWEIVFTMYAGQNYTEGENPSANIESVIFDAVQFGDNVQGINFGSSIKVFIDNARPMLPEIYSADDAPYLRSIASKDDITTEIGSDRTWFTKAGLQMETVCEFEDIVTDKSFGPDLKMYYGVKTINDSSAIESIKSFVTNFASIDFSNDAYKTTYFGRSEFDRTGVVTGDNLDGGESDLMIDFIQNAKANMRVLVIWVIDEAGNKSANVKLYYVLADPAKYTVKSQVLSNAVLGDTASITQVNSDEVATTTFVRGETIKMTLTLADGYVPYKLTKKASADTVVLTNNSALVNWDIPAALEGYISAAVDGNTVTLTYVFDEADNLGDLDKSTVLEFSHRKVVSYTITTNSVRYTGKEVVVPITYSDERIEGIYQFSFKYKGGAEIGTPVIPGKYQVKVTIPENNASFVSSVPAEFTDLTIANGIATVKAVPTTSYYGETSQSDLNFQVEGIDADVWDSIKDDISKVQGSLKLNVKETIAAYGTLKIGKYAVIEDTPFTIQYFDVTFEGNYHEILKKAVEISILAGGKIYGNPDTAYQFTFDVTQVGSVLIANALLGLTASSTSGDIATYESLSFISREPGENAGEYDFITAPESFVLADENYTLTVVSAGKYTISKRTITLEASGQYSFYATQALAEAAVSGIHPSYSLGAAAAYASEITGQLELGETAGFVSSVTETYKAYAVYEIVLGTIEDTDNLTFVLADPATYTIYITTDNTVIISLKDGVKFETPYGKIFDPTNIAYDSTLFDVSGAELGVDFTDVVWDVSIDYVGAGDSPDVGAYEISLDNIKLKKGSDFVDIIGGNEIKTISSQFSLYVVPAVIVIEPIAAVETKTYAHSDADYDIKYQIVSIEDVTSGSYAGSTFSFYENWIQGSFARAIYDKDGNFLAYGSKNDTVSDSNGVIFGTDNFYSYAVLNKFVATEPNGNFVVEVKINKENRLAISKAIINAKQADFNGVDKVYDGTTTARYLTTKACDINALLAAATDDVEISFVANYKTPNAAGADSSEGRKHIVFTSLGLTGAQACNYELYLDGVPVDGETTFTITKKLDGSDIYILSGTISLIRSDFTVAKPYDNLSTLDNNSVSIINRADANRKGTSILYGVKNDMKILSGVFPDKEVSSNYTVDIELFFPLGADADENTITIEQDEKEKIDVSLRIIDGVVGVRVYIQGIGAAITKRVLGYESFSEIKAVDRDYNADCDVTFDYVLASGALAAGDEAFAAPGLILIKGKTAGEQTDVGTYDAEFSTETGSYSISNSLFAKRYAVDVISLKNYYTGARKLSVTINPAKLMPRVEFVSKEYDGRSNTALAEDKVLDRSAGTTQLTTLNYSEKLMSQLAAFSYTFGDVKYYYSKDGQKSANVQAEDGVVVLHNVMVEGLTITEDGANNYLKNYTVYGGVFNSETKEYDSVGEIASGTAIPAYEMFNVAGLTKRKLQVKANDIEVSDKVYDGEKKAVVIASLETSDAIAEDKEYLEVKAEAEYARKQVGNNINVTIVVKSVDVRPQYAEEYSDLINNYDVATFKLSVQRNILPRPVDFSVSFKERIYDGHETIGKNLIKYDLGSMLKDDAKNYSISTDKGAYYLTKDVEYTEYTQLTNAATFSSATDYYQYISDAYLKVDVPSQTEFEQKITEGLYIKEFKEVAKLGTAYNPILFNSKEKYVNYELSVKSETPVLGKSFYAYETEDGIYYGNGIIKVTTETDSYQEGVTYYNGETVDGVITLLSEEPLSAGAFREGCYYIDKYINVKAYYYHMPTAEWYVEKSTYDGMTDPDKATLMQYAIGSYTYGGKAVYLVSEDYTGSKLKLADGDAVRYIQGEGIVKRRDVGITSVEVLKAASFTKAYDGTTKYYGVRGADEDYDFSDNSISNDIAEDGIDVETVSAEFKSEKAGMTQVAFTATGLKTKEGKPEASFNYISAASTSTNKPASITKRAIYAHLDDATMVYGTQISSVKGSVTYFLDPEMTKPVTINNDGWYVEFADFTNVCGFDMATLEEKYKEQLAANRYNESYEKDVNGSLYRLAGTFTEPSVYIEVRGAKQNVGYVAEKFTLKGGSATNFAFVPIYTDTAAQTSKLTVVKRKIYVIADATKTYLRDYGTDLSQDAVKILFVNEIGKDGIVSGETSLDVYTGSLKVEFRKVLASDISNIASAPAVTAKSLINETVGTNKGLDEGYYYVAYIKAEDFNSVNYDVVLSNDNIMFDEETKKFAYNFDGVSFKREVPQLTIVLPEITDVTLAADFKEVTFNNTNQAGVLASGLGANDVATIDTEDAKNVLVDASGNVIAYEGDLIITRTLMKHEEDNEYKITLNLGHVSLKINKASAGLFAKKEIVEYDGQKHTVNKNSYGVNNNMAQVTDSNFTIKYYVDGKEIDITKESIINAGTYMYEVIFESTNNNFAGDTKRAQFVVSPALINVKVDKTKLVQEYIAGKVYTIAYVIEDVKGIGITKEDTELKFVRGGSPVDITKAGRYGFVIQLKADKANEYGNNIAFNNNTGNLDLTVSEIIAYNTSDEEVARIQLKNAGDSILADEFTSRYVYATNNKSEDDLYFASVNQYMASITETIGSDAKLAVVVKMGLTYGVNYQTLNNQDAIITVVLPENIDKSLNGYALYTTNASGGLTVLKQGDYTNNGDGTISYTTNYLGSLVIVSLAEEGLSPAAIGGIAGGAAAFVLIVAGAVAVTLIKKKKMLASL